MRRCQINRRRKKDESDMCAGKGMRKDAISIGKNSTKAGGLSHQIATNTSFFAHDFAFGDRDKLSL